MGEGSFSLFGFTAFMVTCCMMLFLSAFSSTLGVVFTEEKRMEYAKGVADGSRRLADMMTNILKLNRLENQQIYPEAREYDLGEQLCECLLQYENVWEKAEIEIDTDIAEDIKVKVKADAELLSHVWNNLFSNAFKFTEAGGKVVVTLTATSKHAIVKTSDTGCGMSKEVGEHIFEKFYQGDTSHATQGNGLGLALVKRVIDILQGEIIVIGTLLSAAGLIAVFVNGWDVYVTAIVIYVFSFYSLTAFCIACIKTFPGYYRNVKGKVYENKYAGRYFSDKVFKTHVNLYRSLLINIVYVATNIVSVIVYDTNWFGIFAIYYAIMAMSMIIKLASALFSMLFLETAMFSQFGQDTPMETKRIMIMATGAGISVIVVTIAIYMIVHSSKEIKELRG